MRFHSPTRLVSGRGEQGYVLLTLLLIVALIIIFAAAIVPSITFNIKRDREEEMIHRGVQYSRAIRAYYKKFGRYPTKLEDLESTNNLRFLRKRYKDPITGKDFKLLHFGEVKLTFSGGIGSGGISGASPLNNSSPFGSQTQQPGGINGGGAFGNSSTGFGGTQNSAGTNSNGANANGISNDTGQNDSSTQVTPIPGQKDQPDQLSTQVFGGGPIVGVASTSKKDTIREFNHKKKYNEWQFIYDPATDRGGLLMTPNQPQIQGFGQQGVQNVNGQNGNFGPGTGLPPAGMQNNPNLPVTGTPGTTTDQSNPPEQK